MDCALCEAVAGQMQKIQEEFAPLGVEIMAIYTGSYKAKRKEWLKYISEKGYEWTNLIDKKDTEDMFAKYNLAAVPAIYLLDEQKCTLAKDITPKMLHEILTYLLYD
jgi:hypothetical protein